MIRPLAFICVFMGLLSATQAADGPVELAGRRELFVDHFLIERLEGARIELHAPRDEGPVIRFEESWEGPFCGYSTIIKDGEIYRAYYRGMPKTGDGTNIECTCYAESRDGVHWTKPKLGLFEINGSKENNVILAHSAPLSHNFCPMLDTRPGTPEDARYKALGGTAPKGLVAFVSPDGIHWKKLRDEPVITDGAFDSQNVPLWSEAEQSYLCYLRVFKDGYRRIARAKSADFVTWSKSELMEYRSPFGDVPSEHHYTNQTHPYFRAPHLLVAIAARFMPGRQVLSNEQAAALKVNPGYFKDTSDAVFLTTRGGTWYDRTFLEGFLRPGIGAQNWVSRTNYPALNVVQTGPHEMSLYVNQDYAQPTSHLHRYSLRLDGFSSLRAPLAGGELVTKPFRFSGNQLVLNFSTSAAGGIRVELQDDQGKALPGFTLDECQEVIGNEIERAVTWKGGSDVSRLSGTPVRMRLVMKDADVFSFQFASQ